MWSFLQAVHTEMQEALHERDELKLRLHSYISEVARIESMMAAKVRDGEEKTPKINNLIKKANIQ